MELLGESMSMLRMSPDASRGISVTKCVSVGLEMLDCIEAFHSHGYVHRDIKASNFASSLPFTSSKRKYYIIDFGLSRQYRCDGKIVPAREKADFRGTSMYASLSAHRRQELSPKDDLWSWLYLLLDFMRGELPWALDAQQKNRQIVLELKEYYTEKKPELLVDGLVGAQHLLGIIRYFFSLKYEDSVNYDFIRSTLLKFLPVHEPQEDVFDEWEKLNSDADRALLWASKVEEILTKKKPPAAFGSFYTVAKRFQTFFDCSDLKKEEFFRVQQNVYRVEQLIVQTQLPSPPPIQSFSKRRQSEQKLRDEGMKKRRERERKIRQDIEQRILKPNRQVNSLGDVNTSVESSIISKSDENGDTYSAIEQARRTNSALSPNGHVSMRIEGIKTCIVHTNAPNLERDHVHDRDSKSGQENDLDPDFNLSLIIAVSRGLRLGHDQDPGVIIGQARDQIHPDQIRILVFTDL
uniref:Casein kinase I n=1 Tax=Albugo laibachii Nc14 TaxID=890382 RepID=F0WEM1_9STRA|nr:tautubulin kinase putative [Albugo laibachii Nc14]CCA23085.1 tautubulin kinase putative [Albugo laibachii Nc14]|eukprot:CCA23085.1 tautubulin kinase putative [Albugo laibachii Nc14]